MKYIQKESVPQIISDWIADKNSRNEALIYNSFTGKKELNELLRAEQKHICCYCQQRINRFNQNNNGNCHNEHLVPQQGINGDFTSQMDYSNIYASCSFSSGTSPKHQYCGTAKGDNLIHPFIQNVLCSTFFKYLNGEIIPNSNIYDTYAAFIANEATLSDNEN